MVLVPERTQFPTPPHLLALFSGTLEVLELRITFGPLGVKHLAGVTGELMA